MLNKVILQGRICKDLELKFTPNNVEVCSFTIAVERNYCKQGEQRQADFINIVTFRNTAKIVAAHFSKGKQIIVVGSLQTRTWDDTSGAKHYATEVIAEEINFCGDKQAETDNRQADTTFSQTTDGFAPIDTDDSLPF